MDLTTIAKGRSLEKQTLHRAVYAKFYGYALKIAFRYLHDYERATIATNITFADIFKNVGYLQLSGGEHSLKSLITKRTVINVLRLNDASARNAEVKLDAGQTVLEALSPVNFDARLVSYLGHLSLWHRALFNMHVIDGFTLTEIAQHFRLTESSCALQLQEAKTLLTNLVRKEPYLQ